MVDDTWVGDAAEQYRQIIPLQKIALDKIKAGQSGFTDGIALVMSQFRTAIFVFLASLIVALGALAAGIIVAIATADTVFGLPAGPFIAAAIVVVALTSCWIGAQNLKSAAASANTQLRTKLNDNTGYPNGKWPPGVLH